METKNKAIAEQFSNGKFPECYDYFTDEIIWNIVGDKTVAGKPQVIAFCDKMMKEMASSILNNTSIIAANNQVAIEGYCDYMDADNIPWKVSYCDVYRFESDKIISITSYCINKKQ